MAGLPRPAETESAAPTAIAAPCRLRGIVLRRELALTGAQLPAGAEAGRRLSAAETGFASGIYYPDADGLERLTPADAEPLSAARVEALLAAAPEEGAAGRLVTGQDAYLAALWEGTPPEKGASVRLSLDGADRPLRARVVDTSEGAALLRLTEGADFWGRVRFVSGTAEPAQQ